MFGALTAENIRALVEHLIEQKRRPSITPRIRQAEDKYAWLWTKKNKALATRADYWSKAAKWMIIAGVVGIIFARSSEMLLLLSVASFIIGLIIKIKIGRQPAAVRSSGKSEREPRTLVLYDSWQAVLFGAAGSVPIVRARFDAILRDAPIRGFKSSVENIQYRLGFRGRARTNCAHRRPWNYLLPALRIRRGSLCRVAVIFESWTVDRVSCL